MANNEFNIDDYLPKATTQDTSQQVQPTAFNIDDYLGVQGNDVTGLGEKQAVDFATQLANFPSASPVQQYIAFEQYGNQYKDHLTQKGYSGDQIAQMMAEFSTKADPRNQTGKFEYYVGDLGNDVMIGTGNLVGDALAAVPESIPVIGSLADQAEKYVKDTTKAWENDKSARSQIQTYLGNRAEQQALANGASEISALMANLGENPMQIASLLTQQAPQLLLGGMGKAALTSVNVAGGAGRVRSDIEEAYETTAKENPSQLLQLPEIKDRMANGMSFEEAVNDAKTDITDNWNSIVAGAVIGGTEAFTPLGKFGQGVNRGVLKTLGKEVGQEVFQEGAEQLNSNLAVGSIDGKTQAFDNVIRNSTLGGIAGLGTGIPTAIEAGLNKNSPVQTQAQTSLNDDEQTIQQENIQSEQPNVETAQAEQAVENPQQNANSSLDETALSKALAGVDEESHAEFQQRLERDLANGKAENRKSGKYGKFVQDYLAVNAVPEVVRQQQQAEQEQGEGEVASKIQPPKTVAYGNMGKIELGSQGSQEFGYQLVEADELNVNLKPNQYQNRDRTSADSQAQIMEYAANLNPNYLGASVDVTQGAPTVDNDYGVFAGNGRLAAIKQAYAKNPERATAYKNYLAQNAEQFGLQNEQVQSMKQPVLVRKVSAPIDIQKAVEEGNFNTGLDKGVLGNARENANYISDDLLDLVQFNEDGSLNLSEGNTPFIQGLVANVPVEHRPRFFAEKKLGNQTAYTLTAQGRELVENALLTKAYSDGSTYADNLLTDLITGTDEGNKRVKAALISTAGKIIQTKGTDYDISPELIQAYDLMTKGKKAGLNAEQAAAQGDMLNQPSNFVQDLVKRFYSPKSIAEVREPLNDYLGKVVNSGLNNTAQDSMFGDDFTPSKQELLNQSEMRASRSPIKSVEANIKRGREAMNIAITERRTVHRAMFNHELGGWVDFEWGDDGLTKPFNKKGEPVGKGIAHIIEARQRKDGMSYQDVVRMLTNNVVETIAKGEIVHQKRNDKFKEDRITIDFDKYRVALLKRDGGNAWIITGFEKFADGERSVGNDTTTPTHPETTLTRQGVGASENPTDEQVGSNDPSLPTHSLPTRQRQGMGAVGTDNVQQFTQQRNNQIVQDQATLSRILGEKTASHIQVVDSNTQIPTGQNVKKLAANGVEGWFDVSSQKLYIISDNITANEVLSRDERLAWVAFHELSHAGVRIKFGTILTNVLASAGKNVVVKVLTRKIQAEYGYTQEVAIEEAMAEIYAAFETGNWSELESRYKVKIHQSYKQGKDSVGDFLTKVANILRRLIGDIVGKDLTQTMTTSQVFDALRGIQQGIDNLANTEQNQTAGGADNRYSFAGRNAKTANHSLLTQAESDLASGKDPETVRQETGWFKGADGKMRFEIDDSQTGFIGKQALETLAEQDAGMAMMPIQNVIQHHSLFEAYPELADIEVVYEATSEANGELLYGAWFDPQHNQIVLGNGLDEQQLKSSLLHELQHAIQKREHFARGGSPDLFKDYMENDAERAEKYYDELRELKLKQPPETLKLFSLYVNSEEEYERTKNPEKLREHIYAGIELKKLPDGEKLIGLHRTASMLYRGYTVTKEEQYKRLAGETEARNVQTRMNMTAEERLNRSPESTEDVRRDEQIVRYADGSIANSLNENPNSDFAKAVDDVFNSDNRSIREEWIDLGTTPKPLIEAGIDDLPMFMNKQKIGKIKNEHPEMTADLLKQIPKQLNNPVIIFKNTKKGSPENSYVIFTELLAKNGNPVIAAIHANRVEGGLELNKLASVYGRNEAKDYLANMAKYADVRFVDKQKAREFQDTLQLLAPETLNELFDKVSIVKNADESNTRFSRKPQDLSQSATDNNGEFSSENEDIRYSRKQSAMETANAKQVNQHPNVFERVKNGGFTQFKKEVEKARAFIDTKVHDRLRPVMDWIDGIEVQGLSPYEKSQLKDSIYAAEGIKSDIIVQAELKYLNPIRDDIAAIAKKYFNGDGETALKKAGFWISTRWAIEKNAQMLKADYDAMIEAEQEYNDAVANGEPMNVQDRLERAFIKAENQYYNRKADVESRDFSDGRKYKAGTAGGWSTPLAKAIMAKMESQIPRAELEALAERVYDLNEWKLKQDLESGRFTVEEVERFKQDRHYVPLTGDPSMELDDMLRMPSNRNPNVAKDKGMEGRKLSEADDAITAIWESVAKTATYNGWQPMKAHFAKLYDQAYQEAISNGSSQKVAADEATEKTGIAKQKMQGLTRTSDNVLIYKENGNYYELSLPEKAMEQIKKQNSDNTPALLRPVQAATGWLARGVTQFKPHFAMVNMVRDLWEKSEFVRTKEIFDKNGNPLSEEVKNQIGREIWKQAMGAIAGQNTDVWKVAKRYAMKQGLRDDVPAERELKTLLKNGGVSTHSTLLERKETDLIKTINKRNSSLAKGIEKAIRAVEIHNGIFDIVSSISANRALLKYGVDPKHASAVTLDLTNFRKQGDWMPFIKSFYMFAQPAAIGGANLIKMMGTKTGRVRLLKGALFFGVLSFILRSIADEDETGNAFAKEGDKDRFIPISIGEYNFKLPVGYGAPQLMWNMGYNITEAIMGDKTWGDAAASTMLHAFKAVAPVSPSEVPVSEYPGTKALMTLTPTIAQPIVQNIVNRNAFGSQLASSYINDKSLKAEQGKMSTAPEWTEAALWLNDTFGMDFAPEHVKNFVQGYANIVPLMNETLTILVENPNKARLGKPESIPFINAVVGPKNPYATQSQFYRFRDEANDTVKNFNSRKERGTLPESWKTDPEIRWQRNWFAKVEEMEKLQRKVKSNLTRLHNEGKLSTEVYQERLNNLAKDTEAKQRKLVGMWRFHNGLNTTATRD